ncbi:MAG: hypothetical protein ACOCVG_01330 [Verrucomicrobiota bacterium]
MLSGNPDPEQDLALLIEQKRNTPGTAPEVVAEASRWLKAQLKGANVKFTYLSCDTADYYGYSVFIIHHIAAGGQSFLEVKLAEIDGKPFAFCKVRIVASAGGDESAPSRGEYEIFSFSTEIAGSEGQRDVLALIADFVLSMQSGDI